MNKKELVEKINSLDALTVEEKSAIIDLLKQKKYGLVWENKPEDVEERLRAELPVLKEVKDKALLDGGDYAPNHILIEGDNLEALTALTYTHENKIDVIYIDPPYNTGNKDFIYNDSFVDAEDGYRHSKWLSFMEKRLNIAKRLLSTKGVIFISIDDNEQANLKLLCDEVFGREKFICNYIWQKKTGAADAKGIAVITEYILVYCMNPNASSDIFAYNKEAFDLKRYRFSDEYESVRGPHYFDSLDRGSIRYSDSQNFPITAPDGTQLYPNDRTDFVNDGWTWKWSKDKVQWGLKNGFISIVPNQKKKNGWSVKYKIYLNVDNEGNLIKKNVPFKNLISDILNTDATNEIKELFGSKAFNYAKPTSLIKKFISNIENKYYKILDFFAGSGTTLHATMQLNAEDGGHRKCILVTNNENNICEEVTYERNKRVINGYTTPKGEEVEGLKANNLRYYQIDHVERESSLTAKRKLMAASAELLCIKHDIYEESTTFGTLKLKPHIARYFTDGKKQMLVIYMVEAIERIVEEIQAMPEDTNIMVYVFSTNNYAMDADFEDVADKVTLCALPAAIYNAYLKVLPKKGEPKQIIEEDAE